MKFTVYGDKIDLAEELREEFRKPARDTMKRAVDRFVAKIQENASRFVDGKSRPGRFPVRRSGDLERSFKRGSVRLGRDKASYRGDVVSTLPYEEVNGVEYGHVRPTGQRVLPRPFIRPAAEVVEPEITAMFEEVLG